MPELKRFTLLRNYKADATTGAIIGSRLGYVLCQTLERPNLHNQRDNPATEENESSCIPEGIYICKKYSSEKYPDTWEITGVPGRKAILFHTANYVSQLKGCIAICNQVLDMNPKNDKKFDESKRWQASQSRDAFDRFKVVMPKEFELQIVSPDTLCDARYL